MNVSSHEFHCHLDLERLNVTCYPQIILGHCWEQKEFGNTQTEECPITGHRITRLCTTDSGWEPPAMQVEEECIQSVTYNSDLKFILSFIGCPLSIFICLFSFCFILFKRVLREKFYHQLSLHLYFSLMLYAVLTLVVIVIKKNKENENIMGGLSCAILTILYLYFSLSRFSCLCAEGMYLYKCLTHPFHQSKRTLRMIVAGQWIVPFLITLCYILSVWWFGNSFKICFRFTKFIYIIDAPAIAILVLNFSLAMYVLRVTWKKLKEMNPSSSSNDSDMKSTSHSMQDESAEGKDMPMKRGKKQLKSFFSRQKRDCTKWFRMSRSSIIVCITLGLHFLPAIIPPEAFDEHSSVRQHFIVLNLIMQSFTGAIICLMSFLLKPDVRRQLNLYSCDMTRISNRFRGVTNDSNIDSSKRSGSKRPPQSNTTYTNADTLQSVRKSDAVWFSDSSVGGATL